VIIPAYNEEGNIGHLLRFLANYPAASRHQPVDLQVWVDISGSSDRTPEIVNMFAQSWASLHVLDSGAREGLLRALNRMLAVAQGDLVLRLDADVQVGNDTLDSLIARMADRQVGIVSPRIQPAPSPSPWVTRLSEAEYGIHHEVSLLSPKTTVVQLFRGVPLTLRADSGVEDQELQSQVTAASGRASYDPASVATIVPPSNVRNYLVQRLRTIQHLILHRQRGYTRPATDSPRVVGLAVLGSLRSGRVSVADLFLFLTLEGAVRLMARLGMPFRTEGAFDWTPLPDTKCPSWGTSALSESPSGPAGPGNETFPRLMR
jgi:hypothetical protein